MAVYKVPQDVEADDKLIGPFSFRQFVYLIVVALAIGIAWGLAQLLLPLAIIPLPIIIVFGALALPLRKDQPMEVYLAAVVSFYLKPHKRLWEADGIESLIEITVPKIIEAKRTKDLSQGEVQKRFSYLAEIVDSQGWAVRGHGVQAPNSAMRSDVYFESQQVEDVLDNDATIAQSLDFKLDQSDAKRHQEMVDIIRGKSSPQPAFTPTPLPPVKDQHLVYNPYPGDIQQTIIQPLNPYEQYHEELVPEPEAEPSITTSDKPLAPGIINLASNTDLSIEAIAREANRIQDKQDLSEEVVISLR
ncbi:MAG: PrgI family protein [Candidatus Saccharimonadales bacterium]